MSARSTMHAPLPQSSYHPHSHCFRFAVPSLCRLAVSPYPGRFALTLALIHIQRRHPAETTTTDLARLSVIQTGLVTERPNKQGHEGARWQTEGRESLVERGGGANSVGGGRRDHGRQQQQQQQQQRILTVYVRVAVKAEGYSSQCRINLILGLSMYLWSQREEATVVHVVDSRNGNRHC